MSLLGWGAGGAPALRALGHGLWIGVCLFGLGACSTSDLISSKPEVKAAAYGALQEEWGRVGGRKVGRFGRERSAHVFEGDKVERSDTALEISGAFGMLAFVSGDGYALTARHVVPEDGDRYVVLMAPERDGRAGAGERRVPVHLHWLKFTVRDREGVVTAEGKRLHLLAYRDDLAGVGPDGFEVVPVRTVATFPDNDLALVKAPVRVARWFDVRGEVAGEGTVLFVPGNSATPYAGVSAGEVVGASRSAREPVWRLHASAPLASGDSGGPAVDAGGALAGVVSHVRLGRLFPWPKLNHSIVRQIDVGVLERLIEADRRGG